MTMKIHLYLYDYELTFTSVWNCLFFPNVGEQLYIFPFLTQEDRTELEDILCGDVADDVVLSSFQERNSDVCLSRLLESYPCLIETKTWNYIDDEWICSFMLKI